MKKTFVLVLGVLGMLLWLLDGAALSAGPSSSRDRKGPPAGAQVTATPRTVRSPLTSGNKMSVCVSGFSEGDCVTVSIPWMGTVNVHSVLSFGQCADLRGGFCVNHPPDWTTASLEPGVYTIETIWYADGSGGDRMPGPTTTFEVLSD
jgi:hypothetical protein